MQFYNSTREIPRMSIFLKTALLTQFCNSLLNSQLHFDFVIWVVASQGPDQKLLVGHGRDFWVNMEMYEGLELKVTTSMTVSLNNAYWKMKAEMRKCMT
ncbi:hypothetical protein Peur_012261 [Populus x canadensis]